MCSNRCPPAGINVKPNTEGCRPIKGVENHFWYNGEHKVVEMQEKKCYFLNIGYPHAVFHKGMGIRHYLMGSIAGQRDFECIRFMTDNN